MPERDIDTPHVAVTGAAGYIGSRVVHDLQEQHPNWEITALDNFYRGQVRSIGDLDIEHVDIRHRNRLEDALSGADIVMHLAAISGVDDCDKQPDLAYEVNVQGTENVAWFCRKTGAGMIFPFSMAVLGDPQEFPLTVDHPRDPLNWYGRTKLLNERAIEDFADGAFPAHQFMISNLYGGHDIGGEWVSKPTVTNFFLSRALAGETLTVYEPGTQSRNFVHVKDVSRAYLRSAERMLEQLEAGETGTEQYEIASGEDPSVHTLAKMVKAAAAEHELECDVELVTNPRAGEETLVESFAVDTTRAREMLDWTAEQSIESTVRERLDSETAD